MRILSLLTLLSWAVYANGQIDVRQRLTFKAENVNLPTLFDLLEKQCGITVVYGTDNLPASLRVSISGKEITLLHVVQEICRQANLSYYIIDRAIVFKYSQPKVSGRPNDVAKQNVDSLRTNPLESLTESKTLQATQNKIEGSSMDSLHHRDSRSTEPAQDTLETLPMSALTPTPLPDRKRSNTTQKTKTVGLFLTFGFDFNRIDFVKREIVSETYSIDSHQSFSIGASLRASNRIYLFLSAGYASKDFTLSYNYKILDPDDPFPIPEATRVKARYLEIPLSLGYAIYSKGNFNFSFTVGFIPCFLIERNEITSYLNKVSTKTGLFQQANKTVYGGTLGAIAQYNFGYRWGVFIAPDYQFFIGTVNETAIHTNATMYRLKFGLHFSP